MGWSCMTPSTRGVACRPKPGIHLPPGPHEEACPVVNPMGACALGGCRRRDLPLQGRDDPDAGSLLCRFDDLGSQNDKRLRWFDEANQRFPAFNCGCRPAALAQSSSSSSLLARSRPVSESTAILSALRFTSPLTCIELPSREIMMLDHPSAFSFASTCSAVTGRSPAMNAGPGCCARAIMRPVPPISNAPAMRHTTSRVMALSFVVNEPEGANRSAFKAKLNGDRRRSQLGEDRGPARNGVARTAP